ncbi:MAG: hypothetical protein ACJAS4_002913 [Bacteriovoracaceae bacterium]|jgi:hypothetical protein
MKAFLPLILSFTLLSGCTEMPEEALITLTELGLTIETGEINSCTGKQLSLIQEQLDDSANFNRLKEIIEEKKISILKIQNKKHDPVTCDYAVIENNSVIKGLGCDPATRSGEPVTLSTTKIQILDGKIDLTTESQGFNTTIIQYELHDLTDFEEDALINEVTIKAETGDYISFKKLENLSINFNIERSQQSYNDELRCGDLISLDKIINQIKEVSDA